MHVIEFERRKPFKVSRDEFVHMNKLEHDLF